MSHAPSPRSDLSKRIGLIVVSALLLYLLVSYILLPFFWTRYGRKHPSLEDIPGITYTGDALPGDPLNVALIGTKPQLMKIMLKANWHPAHALSFKSCLEIAEATVLKRPYEAAPVSSLYLFGRKEDLAFEQPVGNDPRKRHHVRFWKTEKTDEDGRPLWVGSAVYDKHVGFSHMTGQITHVTDADVDAERDFLFKDLQATDDLVEKKIIANFHQERSGYNGGGDPWHTDGKLYLGLIAPKL